MPKLDVLIHEISSRLPLWIKDPLKSALRRSQPDVLPNRDWLTWRGNSVLTSEQREFWDANGYLILPRFFGQYRIDEVNALIDRLWADRQSPDNRLVIDSFFDESGGKRISFRDASDEARQVCYKLIDLFLENEIVREMSLEPRLCQILADLLDGDSLLCNTLNFERGSQQDYHFDTFYMPAPVENKMVATWIALEDAHPDSGPLQYYPGSHKIPPFLFSGGQLLVNGTEMPQFKQYITAQIEQRGLKPESFPARAGDVLIWHSQLFHGGSAIRDPQRTRKSIVSHYFRAMDFSDEQRVSIAPGRHYLNRSHQAVV